MLPLPRGTGERPHRLCCFLRLIYVVVTACFAEAWPYRALMQYTPQSLSIVRAGISHAVRNRSGPLNTT